MAEDEALLLWSADPLVSYRAVSSLLQRRPGDEDWLGAILAGALGSEASTSIPARGLTNLMEALRRVVVMVAAYAEDMDDETEEDGEKVELAPEAAAYVVTTVANAFSGLRGRVLGLVDQAPGVERGEEGDVELALAWILKLGRELHRSSHFAAAEAPVTPDSLAALCREAWVMAGRRAVARGLPASCSGMVAARQQILELALTLLEAEEGDEDASLSWTGLVLVSQGLVEGDPADIPEEAETEPGPPTRDDGEATCSLVREPRSTDLLPYRLALLAACLRRVGELAQSDSGEGSGNGAWARLTALLRCPLRMCYMAGRKEEEEEEEGSLSSPLVAALLTHDDLLLTALNDLQRLGIALLTTRSTAAAAALTGRSGHDAALLRDFIRANSPIVLLAGLLEVVDQELLLEYLVSNETRALEYCMRVVKFLVWRLRQGRQAAGGVEEEEDVIKVEEIGRFLVGLGDRLRSLVRRGLFPYDINPLLERLSELRAALPD